MKIEESRIQASIYLFSDSPKFFIAKQQSFKDNFDAIEKKLTFRQNLNVVPKVAFGNVLLSKSEFYSISLTS